MLGPQHVENRPGWFTPIGLLSFSLSLAVNTIFSGLLVFKIAKASLALRHAHARKIQDFTPLISMLIESGLVFFMAQLIWVICFSIESVAFNLTSGPITIIYVRAYLHLPLPSFNVFSKGNYTDNYCGACRNGRHCKYGREPEFSCGKQYGVCIHR